MTEPLFLGVDGGGSGSRLALADAQGNVLSLTHGPAHDPSAGTDWRAGMQTLLRATRTHRIRSAVLGLPFHGEMRDVSQLQSQDAKDLIGPQARVVNDVAVAAAGALAGRPGVLILSGTGSMAWAVNGGAQARAGGFGPGFGDEGSAHDIGRAALQRLSWHIDGRASAPDLAQALLSRLGCGPMDVIEWTYGPDGTRAAIAALARDVAALAQAGEPTADALLAEAAHHLAAQAGAAARSAALPDTFDWTHAGGTFASARLLHHLTQALGRAPLTPRLPPVGGAILMAAQDAGQSVSDSFLDHLARGLAPLVPTEKATP